MIVQLAPSAPVGPAAALERLKGSDVHSVLTRAFHGFSATVTPARIEALERDPTVLAVVPDTRIYALGTQVSPPWGLDRIDQRGQALDQTYQYDTTGQGVVAFVIDTGIRATHSEFTGRILPGHDFVDGDNIADDCNGHGTHVAGTVGGTTYGVAKGVTVEPLRVLDCTGSGYLSDAVAAFDWVIAHKPAAPAVVNFSVGGPASTIMDAAVERTVAAGVAVVVAAGNSTADACTESPARTPGALTIGATTPTDARASFSNYGSCVDLFAPGEGIKSAWIGSDSATATIDGTSMAAPHVTGAVARYLETHPAASPAEVAAWLGATDTLGIVAQAMTPHDDLLYTGSEPQGPAPPPPPVPQPPVVSGSVSPSTVVVNATSVKSYTVSVTTSGRVESRLTGRVVNSSTSESLQFDNPTGDARTWTTTGQIFGSGPVGVWTVTGFSALWADPTGSQVMTSLPTAAPISFSVTQAPKVVLPPLSKAVQIVYVRWDAAGPDTSSNRSLNGEYVRLRNTSTRPVVLSGYTLRDRQNHVFHFRTTTLRAGASLTLHTGRGTRSASTQYWGLRHAVWGNTSDAVWLRDSYNRTTDTARWIRRGRGSGHF